MKIASINSPLGSIEIKGNAYGLASLHFMDSEVSASKTIPKDLKIVASQIAEYFEGKRTDFDVKLAPEGTEFQKKV